MRFWLRPFVYLLSLLSCYPPIVGCVHLALASKLDWVRCSIWQNLKLGHVPCGAPGSKMRPGPGYSDGGDGGRAVRVLLVVRGVRPGHRTLGQSMPGNELSKLSVKNHFGYPAVIRAAIFNDHFVHWLSQGKKRRWEDDQGVLNMVKTSPSLTALSKASCVEKGVPEVAGPVVTFLDLENVSHASGGATCFSSFSPSILPGCFSGEPRGAVPRLRPFARRRRHARLGAREPPVRHAWRRRRRGAQGGRGYAAPMR